MRWWWAFVFTVFVAGGCQGMAVRGVQQLVYPRVCPACDAHSIDQCRCFPVSGDTGYYETNWSSVVPSAGHVPQAYDALEYMETDGLEQRAAEPEHVPKHIAEPAEELPTPEALLPPREGADDGDGTSPGPAGDPKPQVTHPDEQASRPAATRCQGVTYRIHALSEQSPAPPTLLGN